MSVLACQHIILLLSHQCKSSALLFASVGSVYYLTLCHFLGHAYLREAILRLELLQEELLELIDHIVVICTRQALNFSCLVHYNIIDF